MLTFRRFSKQWYWEANKKMGSKDNILIADSCKDGGVVWEFEIQRVDWDINGDGALKIVMFEDAVQSLKNKKVVKSLIEIEGIEQLDNVETVLKKNGFKELISDKR